MNGKIEIKLVNKAKSKSAEVLIYDVIGSGWLGGIGAEQFSKDLKALGDLDNISVRINSEGGSVFDGVAIYNTLISNKAKVTVHIDGLAASIASIIAMAGDEVNMAKNAMFMIHDPWIVAFGSATELREQADLLDKIRGQLIDTYDARSSADKETISELMSAETWMTADEAFDFGFVDNVTQELKIAACVGHPEIFKKAPKEVLDRKEFKPAANGKLKLMRASLNARNL